MKFESLKYEHLRQMVEIEKEAFDIPWTENMFIPEVESIHAYYIVGTRGNEVICYGGYHKVFDEAHITNVAVKSTERGKGFGKLLLSELIFRAKNNGLEKMTLEVSEMNEKARQMYQSFGFRVEGIRKRYYSNKYDALVMWLDIQS